MHRFSDLFRLIQESAFKRNQDLKTLNQSSTPTVHGKRGPSVRQALGFNRIGKRHAPALCGVVLSLLAIFALQVESALAAPQLTEVAAQTSALNQWFTRPVLLIALTLTALELVLIALIALPTIWFVSSRQPKGTSRTIGHKKYIPPKTLPLQAKEGEVIPFGEKREIAKLVDSIDLAEFEDELVAA